jgi:hypothetical protein
MRRKLRVEFGMRVILLPHRRRGSGHAGNGGERRAGGRAQATALV